jgi:hypothetical protein
MIQKFWAFARPGIEKVPEYERCEESGFLIELEPFDIIVPRTKSEYNHSKVSGRGEPKRGCRDRTYTLYKHVLPGRIPTTAIAVSV